MQQLDMGGNRVGRYELGAEIICSLEVTCGSSWGWRSRWRTWTVKSLGDFGAVSRRSIGWYARKTSWYICNTHIHSYLHRWSTEWYDGHLNVDALKLQIRKNSAIKWIQLIFRWRVYLWSLPEIFPKLCWLFHQVHRDQKIWAKTDFSNFGFFRREMRIKLLICSLGRIIISTSANTFVIDHLCHKFNFSIFWTLPAFFEIFHLLLFQAFLVNS